MDPGPWLGLLDDLAGQVDCTAAERPPRQSPPLLRSRLNLRGAGGGDPRAHYLNSGLGSVGWARRSLAARSGWGWAGGPAYGSRASPSPGTSRCVSRDWWSTPTPESRSRTRMSARPRPATSAVSRSASSRGWLEPASPRRDPGPDVPQPPGLLRELGELAAGAPGRDRCVDLLPDEPGERRDRAAGSLADGAPPGALQDLGDYLARAAPGGPRPAGTSTRCGGRLSLLP